jgi:hypothetical protein
VAAVVHGEQRFLHQVLDIVRQRLQAPAEVGAQEGRQFAQEPSVCLGIAALRRNHQIAQPVLADIQGGFHATPKVGSLDNGVRLQQRQKKKISADSARDCNFARPLARISSQTGRAVAPVPST